jgi:hypothetical protein
MDAAYAPLTEVQYREIQSDFFDRYNDNKKCFEVLLSSEITIEIGDITFTALSYKYTEMLEPAYILNSSARPKDSLPVFHCPLNPESPDQLLLSTQENDIRAIHSLFDQIISTSSVIQMKFVD